MSRLLVHLCHASLEVQDVPALCEAVVTNEWRAHREAALDQLLGRRDIRNSAALLREGATGGQVLALLPVHLLVLFQVAAVLRELAQLLGSPKYAESGLFENNSN